MRILIGPDEGADPAFSSAASGVPEAGPVPGELAAVAAIFEVVMLGVVIAVLFVVVAIRLPSQF
ncbi:MAG TPA: hypothetical protein VK095_13115 [Beutenbergiaceae bacterium]|nr:hypothetical protein [Beutenbergiaceae bacterium]